MSNFPGKSPLFEIRRVDPETNGVTEEDVHIGDAKATPRKSQLFKVGRAEAEVKDSYKSSQNMEEYHVKNAKVMAEKRECTEIESDSEDEDYSHKFTKVGPNVSVIKKGYPLYVYTYKVLFRLPFSFHSG